VAVGILKSSPAVITQAITASRDAQAITVPYAQTPRIARYNEAGINVAAGAVINSAVLDLSNVSECTVIADNSGGGVARNLVANWLASDGTTVVYQFSTWWPSAPEDSSTSVPQHRRRHFRRPWWGCRRRRGRRCRSPFRLPARRTGRWSSSASSL
jgi:hypothetical protein